MGAMVVEFGDMVKLTLVAPAVYAGEEKPENFPVHEALAGVKLGFVTPSFSPLNALAKSTSEIPPAPAVNVKPAIVTTSPAAIELVKATLEGSLARLLNAAATSLAAKGVGLPEVKVNPPTVTDSLTPKVLNVTLFFSDAAVEVSVVIFKEPLLRKLPPSLKFSVLEAMAWRVVATTGEGIPMMLAFSTWTSATGPSLAANEIVTTPLLETDTLRPELGPKLSSLLNLS